MSAKAVTGRRFSIAVMDQDAPAAGWRERVLASLASDGVTVTDGELRVGDALVGYGGFAGSQTAVAPLAAWLAAGPRPFVGAACGLFEWTHALADNVDDVDTLVGAIVHAARGAVIRLDDEVLRENVELRSIGVDQAYSDHGFESGAALLERAPGRYVDYVIRTLKDALEGAQIEGWLGFDETASRSRNPIRLFPPLAQAGVLLPAPQDELALAPLEVEIWAFRSDVYETRERFWMDSLDGLIARQGE